MNNQSEALALANQIVAVIQSLEKPEELHAFVRTVIPNVNTNGRRRQRQNSDAFVHLVQACALARSADLASDLAAKSPRYSADSTLLRNTPALITRTEMEQARQAVTQSVTTELTQLSELNIFPQTQAALLQLRTDTVQHMTVSGEFLARTFKTSCCDGNSWGGFMQTLPLAYRHYGVLNDDVINARNDIPNPLFIEPEASIELLTDIT